MIGSIVVGLIFLGWLIKSIKIIGPEEMAVLVLFGVPVGFRDSGFTFVPFLPGCRLARYPKKLYNLDYPARVVISKEGEYPEGSGRKYGAQVLLVDGVAYLRFPRDKNLIQILKSQVPTKDEELLNYTEESVVGSLRVALGKITWKQAAEDIATPRKEADTFFKAPDGALLMAGFKKKDLKLTIKEIKLPKELEEALPVVDKQRLEAEAAPFEAAQIAEETAGAVIEEFCRLKGMPREKVQEELKERPEEFIEKNKDIWNKAWEIAQMRMAIDGRSYLYVHAPQGTTAESLITLFQRTPLGRDEEGGKKKGGRTVRVPGGSQVISEEKSRSLGLP